MLGCGLRASTRGYTFARGVICELLMIAVSFIAGLKYASMSVHTRETALQQSLWFQVESSV